MYAVVKTGGKQYKIEEGEILRFEKIPGDVGSPVTFDQVLMFSDGEKVQIGQPTLENVAVEGRIIEQAKARKVIVFKYKRRKRYHRKHGHRQQYTAVQIDSIKAKSVRSSQNAQAETADQKPAAEKAEVQKAASPKAKAKKPSVKQGETRGTKDKAE